MKTKNCGMCKDIPASLSVNVDDELPSTVKNLAKLFWCDATGAGMGDYGFYKCPACDNYYYFESELSRTGSQMNDYHRVYRFNADEKNLLQQFFTLLTTSKNKGVIDPHLTDLLATFLNLLGEYPYRGCNSEAISVAMLTTLSQCSGNPYSKLIVSSLKKFISEDKKNQVVILNKIEKLKIDKSIPVFASLIRKYNSIKGDSKK